MRLPSWLKRSDPDLKNTDSGISERKIDLHKLGKNGGGFRIPGIDLDVTLRVLISALLLVFFALLQTTIFARFRFFGAVPDLMLPLVIAIGITEGANWGSVFGIVAAFVIESLGGAPISLLALLYAPAGGLAGALTVELFRDSVAVRALFTAVGCVAHMLFTLVTLFLTVEGVTFGAAMKESVLPELLSTAVFAALPHLLAKAALRSFHKPREEKVE